MNGIDQSISPGIGGFITFFLLACALWLLMRNMIGHLRKVDQREELAEERRLAEEQPDASDPPSDQDDSDGRAMVSRPSAVAAEVPRRGRTDPSADAAPARDDDTTPRDA